MLWGEEVSTGQNSARAGKHMTKFCWQGGETVHRSGNEKMVEPAHSNSS
jgi:hypothetical protein